MTATFKSSYSNESKITSLTMHPSSVIYVPLTFQSIEEFVTSLVQASPANHIPMPVIEKDQRTTGTSGPIPSDALARWDQVTQSWKTSQASFLTDTPALLPGSFPKSATVHNGTLYPLPMPVRPTLERDGGVLPGMKATHHVPTPTASDHIRRKSTSSETLNYETNKSVSLDRWAERWMTPNTMDSLPPKSQKALDHEYTHRPNRSSPGNLRDQIAVAEGKSTWPTPRAREGNAGAPRSKGSKHNAGRGYLDGVVQEKWPTPKSQDSKHGPLTEWEKNTNHPGTKDSLRYKVMMKWPTPTVSDAKGSGPAIIRKDGKSRMDRLDYATEQDATSLNKGSLNPNWVSWLMGIPTGWDSLEPMDRNAYDEWFEDMRNDTWWNTERDLPRVATGKIDRAKRLRALGNGIVPASLALFIRDIMDPNSL